MNNIDCLVYDHCSRKHCDEPTGCQLLFKLNYLYDEANVPIHKRYHQDLHPDSNGSDIEAFRQLKNIQDNIVPFIEQGKNLYIHSHQCGCGKTSWSLRLLQTYFNRICNKTGLTCRALFINVPYFLQALKDNISEKNPYITHIKQNVLNCDLVIWDDISNKTGTEFEINNLLGMLDSRITAGKSNLYTSNVAPKDLGNYLDIRLASRIAEGSICIELRGGDKRRFEV